MHSYISFWDRGAVHEMVITDSSHDLDLGVIVVGHAAPYKLKKE